MGNLGISSVHHIAIICSDYAISKKFYTEKLGLSVVREVYREARNSYKLDLALGEQYIIELFSFPNPPKRTSRPEACGLRHIAFQVKDIEETVRQLAPKILVQNPFVSMNSRVKNLLSSLTRTICPLNFMKFE